MPIHKWQNYGNRRNFIHCFYFHSFFSFRFILLHILYVLHCVGHASIRIEWKSIYFIFHCTLDDRSMHSVQFNSIHTFTNWTQLFYSFSPNKCTPVKHVCVYVCVVSVCIFFFYLLHIWHSWKTINSITHCILFLDIPLRVNGCTCINCTRTKNEREWKRKV